MTKLHYDKSDLSHKAACLTVMKEVDITQSYREDSAM